MFDHLISVWKAFDYFCGRQYEKDKAAYRHFGARPAAAAEATCPLCRKAFGLQARTPNNSQIMVK